MSDRTIFRTASLRGRTNRLAAVPLLWLFAAAIAEAQQPPSLGYVQPSGGTVGTSIEVTIGGYDWTPDMDLFVHSNANAKPIRLELLGPPGPVRIPEPPYWFGKKARRTPLPLPREFRARLTIPPETPPGQITWQAANANGATAVGRLVISDLPQVLETDASGVPQRLESLPVTVCGQIERIEEIDRYHFVAAQTGPLTCELISRAIGSALNAVIRVTDRAGNLVSEAVDSAGLDAKFTFPVTAGEPYTVAIHDLDFGGDRSFVYRLNLTPGPRVTAALPAAGTRGQTRAIEFIGYGLATGTSRLETVTREVTFPEDPALDHLDYRLETPIGLSAPIALGLSPFEEHRRLPNPPPAPQLEVPFGITATFGELHGEHRYQVVGKQGDHWSVSCLAQRLGSPLDVAVTVLDQAGTEVLRVDDSAGSTDAEAWFTLPADGTYQIVVSDGSAAGDQSDAIYRLSVEAARAGFRLQAPERLSIPIAGKASLAVKVERIAKFDAPIRIDLSGLPEGVSAPADFVIAAGQTQGNIELNVGPDAAARAAAVSIRGQAETDEGPVTQQSAPMLLAITIPPPFEIDAEGKDDVLKWPRGTTFPGPVLIERQGDFSGPVMLEMHSRQGRHVMGISGPEVSVPPGVNRFLYPVHLPEWLETTRTSRMVVNGVAQVTDPRGNLRHSLVKQKTRMGFLPIGALLKLSAKTPRIATAAGQPFTIPLVIDRSASLAGPLRLELEPCSGFTAAPITLDSPLPEASLVIQSDAPDQEEYELTIRATAWQGEAFPVISRATIVVMIRHD